MHDTVIEGLVQAAFFLATVASFAYLVWAEWFRSLTVGGAQIPPRRTESQQENLLLMSKQVLSPLGQGAGGTAGRSPTQNSKLAKAGDWLVPAIVWLLVILMGAAVVGFLLGDK